MLTIAKRISWVIFLLLSCRSLELVDRGFTYRMEGVWIYGLGAIFLFGLLRGRKIICSRTGAYAAFIMVYFPVTVALVTHLKWDQPLWYGIAIMRRFFLLLFVLMLDQQFSRRKLGLDEVEKILVWTAWAQLTLFLAGPLFNKEVSLGMSAVKGDIIGGKTFFLVYGFFYYAWQAFEALVPWKKYLHAFLSAVFLSVMTFLHKGRGLFFSAALALGVVFVFRKVSARKKITRTILGLFFLLLLGLILLSIFQHEFLERAKQFVAASHEAAKVVVTGKKSEDASANVRLDQIAFMRQNTKNWFFGEGVLHDNWEGKRNILPSYFFASDIGWFGIIYLHGWIGLFILLWQFVLARKYSNEWRDVKRKTFCLAAQTMCLFCFLNSFATGMMSFAPANALVFVLIMQEIMKEQRGEIVEEKGRQRGITEFGRK